MPLSRLILFNILCISVAFAGDRKLPTITVDAKYKGTHKVVSGQTQSIPPHYIYAVDGFNFALSVTMTLERNTAPGPWLSVVCTLPDSSVKTFVVHSETLIEYSDRVYEYCIPVRIQRSGTLKVFVVKTSELNTDTPSDQYSETSNIQSMELLTPTGSGN